MSSHSQTGMHTLTHAWTHKHTHVDTDRKTNSHTHAQRLGHTSRHSEQKKETTDNHNHKQEQAHQHKHRHTYAHTHSSGCVTCLLHHQQTTSPTSVLHGLSLTVTTFTHCCHLVYQRIAWTRQGCLRTTAYHTESFADRFDHTPRLCNTGSAAH